MITQSFNTFVFDYPVTLNAPPTVSTDSPTSISTTSATLGGNVSDDGGASVTERGIIYSTSANPTTADNTIQIGTGTGSFSQNVTGLSPGTTYFVRAYAINSEGTSYGTEQSFTTRVQVQSISRLDPANSLTNQDEVVFQVTFTGPVSGLSSDNFSLTESGLNGASLTSISGSGSTYDVTVHTGAGDGLLRLNVINDSNVTPSILGLPYTDGETYTIDKTPPTITSITSPEDPGPTLAQTLDITIEFSKPVYGFQFSDINVTGDAEVTFSGTDFTDGETSYTFTATHAEDGELNLHIPNETIQDQAGNLNSNTGSYSIQLIRNQPFAGGSGTEVDPWQVTTADELNRIRNFLDGHFILTDDIDLGVAPWNEIEGWAPIGNSANSFDGVLNGNGHSISNLYIDQNIEHVGLFGYIGEDAHISNIRITNADISSNQERVGILAGSLDGHVYEIEVSGTVSGNGRVGGLAGESGEHSTIFKAAAFVEVISTSERAGGLLGANSADISHSYARGTVTGTNRVGGLIGNAFDGAITNNYVSVELSGGSWVRGLVGDRRDNTAGSFSDNYVDEDIANTTNPGNGTFLSSDEMTLYKTFVDAGWNFDTIWGFNHEENDSYPFLKFQNQFTHNLRNSADLADLTVSGDIENLHFDPNTTDYELKVKNDVTSVDVSFSLADGSTGSIESPQTVHLTNGSGVFSVEVTAEDLLTTKTYIITVLPYFESGSGTEADPFVLNTLEQLSNINHFLDSHFVLSQDIDASDTENWNEGEGFEPISASFTGTFNGQGHLIKNLYINRPGSTHTGLFSTITGSAHIHNLGIVDADITGGERTGILAGESRASISEVFTTGAVHGSHYTGGIIGIVEGDNIISRSYSTADVSSSSSRVGGITGYLYGLIEDSYFYDGSVTGISVTGGIAGEIFSGTIERSYVANSLLSDSGIASLSQAGSTVTNSFWDIETTGTTTSAGGTGLTTAELKSKSLFTDSGWDFDTVWQIDTPTDGNISYPYLQQNTQQPAPGFMEVQQPEVVTNSTISDITSGSAVVSGEIIHDGNLPISEVGYSWAPADTPDDTTMVFATLDGTGFTSTLSDLPPGTDIRVIAFASNEIGSSFGESVEFATEKAEVQLAGSFTTDDKSYDGNTTASIQDNNLTLTGVYGSHDLSITDIHVVFENSNASTDLEITIVSATLSGADSDRYLLSLDNAPTSIATILPRQIAVTADDQAVVYGEDDPSLSYTVTAGKLVGDDQFSGDLSRESGLNTGIYEILKGDLTAGDNYEITFHSANFEITPRTLTVRADAGLSKHYGDADPELTFEAENFGWDDDEQVFSGELSRESGESAGTYNITPGNLDAGDNYTIDFTGAEFTILTYGLLVRAEADQAKTYGEADPTLTYTVNGEPASNYESVLSGDLSRQSGEDAGQYAITQGNLSAGSDYTITFEPEDFTITPATLTITADTDQSKTYGEDDPELTFNADGFAFDDDLSLLSGALSRESGESIGDYAIQQGDLDAGDNYTIDFTGAEFTILSYGLLVQAEADQAKIYGEADPTLTYTVNGEPASNYESVLSGTLSRQSGEDAGQYAITQGNLSAGSDYTITFEPEDFTITPATLAITADTDQSKTYGEDDPELTFTANGFVFDDDLSLLSGSLSRNEGENTGDYLITLGDLDAGDNYTIEYTGADFSVTPATLTIIADSGLHKFEGEDDPEWTFTVKGWVFSDDESLLSGTLNREAGEDPGEYMIEAGDLSAGDHYTIEFTGSVFNILLNPPVADSKTPETGADLIAINTPIIITFDQEVILKDVEKISVTDQNGESVAIDAELNTRELSLIHSGLQNGTTYTVLIPDGVVQNLDGFDNPPIEWSFQTILSAPLAESFTPKHGSEGVALDTVIEILFDQEIDIANEQKITLADSDGQPTEFIASTDDGQLLIEHDGLSFITDYLLTIRSGAVQNRDGVGNEELSLSFQTTVPLPDPVVLSVPADGIGAVSLTPHLEWETPDFVETYHLQVSTTDSFHEPVINETNLTNPDYSIASELDDYTVYFWRVEARNDAGKSGWSEVSAFATLAAVPDDLFPVHQAADVSTAPVLEWMSTYETRFRVQLDDSDTFENSLVDTLVTDHNLQVTGLNDDSVYHWRVRVESDLTQSEWMESRSFTTRAAPGSGSDAEPIVESRLDFGGTSNRENRNISDMDYRLVSLPGTNGYSLEQFFDGEYGTEWRAFLETGAETDFFEEFEPDDDRFVFMPGRGFWVLSTDIIDLELPIASVTTNELDAYSIELHPGWNIISNPHSGSVSWSDVQELNDITGEIFAYNQHFMSTDSLQPVQGYYYYNDPTSEASILEIPYSTMDQRRSNEGEQAAKSRLNASMLAAPATAGITAHFDQGPDLKAEMVYDVPTDDRGRYLRPYPSLEMSRTGMMFIDDSIQRGGLLRAESYYHSEGNEYSLELKGEVGDRFVWRVSLSGLGNRARVLLINPVSNVSWILADGEEAEARMSEPTTTYRVFIGDEHYLTEMQQDLMPQEVSLQPNYPNPFNPATNIRYSIPQQQHVRLVVYDVIGRRVQVLQDGIQQAGWHNAQFDAGNLASGVYFYRLQVGEVMHTGRMTLIK